MSTSYIYCLAYIPLESFSCSIVSGIRNLIDFAELKMDLLMKELTICISCPPVSVNPAKSPKTNYDCGCFSKLGKNVMDSVFECPILNPFYLSYFKSITLIVLDLTLPVYRTISVLIFASSKDSGPKTSELSSVLLPHPV